MTTNLRPAPFFGVVATIADTDITHAARAISDARPAHTVEFRLDSMRPRFDIYLPWVAQRIKNELAGKKIILTLRSQEQGGIEYISPHDQLEFWRRLPRDLRDLLSDEGSSVFADWGLDIVARAQHKGPHGAPFSWKKIGCSLHEFKETPENLPDLLGMIEETPAHAFLKLVTMTQSVNDLPRIKRLFEGRIDSRPLIAFGMGPLGESSRRSCLIWGSAATYGYLRGHTKGAPGQLTIDELLKDPSVQAALQR